MVENHPKIIASIDTMISDAMLGLQFYGEFCQFINFKSYKPIKTCGVTVDVHGMKFYFNPEFVDELTQEEMNFIMLHEIFHLLWDHRSRSRKLGYEHELSNVVQDMIINDIIKTDIVDKMKYKNKVNKRDVNFADIPVNRKSKEAWILHKPEEYKGSLFFEEMYEWISDEKDKYDEWKSNCKCDPDILCKCNRSEGKEPCSCPECPVSNYLRSIFDQLEMGILEFLDCHLPCDLPEEYRRSLIENIKNGLKARGLDKTGDILETLEKLTKSKRDHIKDIKIGINELFGNYKQKSMTKRNRRGIPGVKGKRKDAYALNVMLDVSGSMFGYFEKAISYIFQNGIKINIIQCDTEIKAYTVITSKAEFKKLKIYGGGGTTLQPGINYISGNKELNKLNTLVLTDGYCDDLDVTKLKKCMIITHGKACKVTGKVKQIVVKD